MIAVFIMGIGFALCAVGISINLSYIGKAIERIADHLEFIAVILEKKLL